ncbi:hypothetical protein D3C77_671280 [compost metagenome]
MQLRNVLQHLRELHGYPCFQQTFALLGRLRLNEVNRYQQIHMSTGRQLLCVKAQQLQMSQHHQKDLKELFHHQFAYVTVLHVSQ